MEKRLELLDILENRAGRSATGAVVSMGSWHWEILSGHMFPFYFTSVASDSIEC